MPNYESYFDVLSENTHRHNVLGSTMIVLLVLVAALAAVSLA